MDKETKHLPSVYLILFALSDGNDVSRGASKSNVYYLSSFIFQKRPKSLTKEQTSISHQHPQPYINTEIHELLFPCSMKINSQGTQMRLKNEVMESVFKRGLSFQPMQLNLCPVSGSLSGFLCRCACLPDHRKDLPTNAHTDRLHSPQGGGRG